MIAGRRQAGLSIITAIFLLLILAVLGAIMVNVANMQHASSAMDVLGSRAYQAARAGGEWGAYQATKIAGYCAVAPTSTTLPAMAGDLAPFAVTVRCTTRTTYTDGAASITVYQIESTASSGGSNTAGSVERQVQATVVGQ